ncbi:hypothetical protein F4780DRAFT_293780 [Xylariomycetidae sp. FL0641]|nr:hypothetical protein F4780DRAFT_293780 [Xylariomycetidae sp. FL0641]
MDTMEAGEVPDHYYTYEGRFASFRPAQPAARRTSNAKGRASKAPAWPHKKLHPEHFARAGFYFAPTSEHPDNTVCFLCLKNVDGWEENDNPFEQHLRLSPHCGWAIVSAIAIGLSDYGLDDPTSSEMSKARKATFAGRWPHEGKKGWKCKTKQLVDAGWKYTPTMESDDMATCTYCDLALDGWEPTDNPWDEHYRRSPDCQYFNLINQYQAAPSKKKGRGKGARTSKASRLSTQSIATAASEAPSMLDHTADPEDSIMTTTSIMTQGGTKRTRAKKTTTAKGKRTKAKKDEPVEVVEDPQEMEVDVTPAPPAKPTRGRKRGSDAVEDSVLTATEAPAAKKRATRGRKSNATNTSTLDQSDLHMADVSTATQPKTRGRKARASTARRGRKPSLASTVSNASVLEDHMDEHDHIMDDEELDRQLQADMDRPLSDDEDIAADSDSERKNSNANASKSGKKRTSRAATMEDHAMFDPAPPQITDDEVDAELKTLEDEMRIEPDDILPVAKKGRKTGTRKVSKQTTTKTTTKKTKSKPVVEPESEPEGRPEPEPALEAEVDELAEGHDVSIVSNATVVRTSLSSTASAPRKRGRPSKKSLAEKAALKNAEAADAEHAADAAASVEPPQRALREIEAQPTKTARNSRKKSSLLAAAAHDIPPPATPKAVISPAPAAKQAAVSPSQSPQSSDAENQPPSSKPSNTANSKKMALGPAPATPMRSSPSKRNVIGGLQTDYAWTSIDLEEVFDGLEKENGGAFLKNTGELTSPEQRMTVEEWIYHNAGQVELKLKQECEAIVSSFENEGTRAMRALEGIVAE